MGPGARGPSGVQGQSPGPSFGCDSLPKVRRPRALARGRPDRGAVRAESPGGGRELRPGRRCGVGGVPVGDHHRAADPACATQEHGEPPPVRQPCRRLAGAAPVRRARPAAHRPGRRHGDRVPPGAGAGDGRSRPRTATAGSTSSRSMRGASGTTSNGRSPRTGWSPAAARLAAIWAAAAPTPRGWSPRRAASSTTPAPAPTSCLNGTGAMRRCATAGRSWWCPLRWTPTACASPPRAGYADGKDFFSCLCDSFDMLSAEGGVAPRMPSIGLHGRLAGRPGRAMALARLLDYMQRHGRVRICRRIDIDRHRRARHPLVLLPHLLVRPRNLHKNYTIR